MEVVDRFAFRVAGWEDEGLVHRGKTVGRHLKGLGRWRTIEDGLIQRAYLCRPKDAVLFHPGD